MTSPVVSIIIPCFNGEEFVRSAVDSAISQSYQSVEVIVVNDGSTDNTATILKEYEGRLKVINQENKGLAEARNSGIRNASGQLLVFLDSDDYISHDFVEKMEEPLRMQNADIAYCGWQNIGLLGGRGMPYIPPDYQNMKDAEIFFIQNTPWPVHAVMIKKELVEKFNGFDRRWSTCEDFALWIYATEKAKIVRVKEVMAFYRHHAKGQMTSNRALIAINHWKVQRQYLRSKPYLFKRYGEGRIRRITHGNLLKRGYECYWDRDLEAARKIFRMVMRQGYGTLRDWLYMVPSLLPFAVHSKILAWKDRMRIS